MSNYEVVVLGCINFFYYKDMVKKLCFLNVSIIDGNIGIVKNLKRILKEMNLLNEGNGSIIFYNLGIRVEDKVGVYRYNMLFKRMDSINE